MRQLDLFGSFFEIPAKEEKPEEIQPDLKKEGIPAVIVNEEIPSPLIDITDNIPTSLPLPEKADSQINEAVTTIEEPTIVSPVSEIDVEQQPVFPQHKELKTDDCKENEESQFEDEKSAFQLEDAQAANEEDAKTNLKKEPEKRGRKSLQGIEAEVDLIEVPEDEVLFKKQYYPISEVARWFRVNTSLLRFWEKEFDILKPKKNGKGDRLFRPEDVKNLQLIYQLLRQRKYTIEGAKEYIKTNKKKADVEMELANTLQKFKSFLLDLKANL